MRRTILFVVLAGSLLCPPAVEASLIDLQMRAVETATATDSVAVLPSSLPVVAVGDTFYLEVWMNDVGDPLTGISGGYLDIAYDTTYVDATGLNHGSIYTVLQFGAINDPAGLIDEFGGSYLGLDTPGTPDWALLGRVTIEATSAGTVTFTPQESDDEFSRFSAGSAPWAEINAPELSVDIVPEPSTLLLFVLGVSFSVVFLMRHWSRV